MYDFEKLKMNEKYMRVTFTRHKASALYILKKFKNDQLKIHTQVGFISKK